MAGFCLGGSQIQWQFKFLFPNEVTVKEPGYKFKWQSKGGTQFKQNILMKSAVPWNMEPEDSVTHFACY